MRPLLKQLGARLKQLREEQGLSVVDVAGSTRVHKSTIYNIEAGRHPPSMKHLSALAQALRCDELDLLCFPGAHPRHDLLELLRRAPLSAVVAVKAATAELVAGDEKKQRKPKRET